MPVAALTLIVTVVPVVAAAVALGPEAAALKLVGERVSRVTRAPLPPPPPLSAPPHVGESPVTRRRGVPPPAATTQTPPSRENAIALPSGFHAGWLSPAPFVTSRTWAPPAAA